MGGASLPFSTIAYCDGVSAQQASTPHLGGWGRRGENGDKIASMRKISASDLMNSDVLTVPEDMTVRELATFLIDHQISGAPVVDRQGKPVGVVSMADIVAVASEDSEIGGEEANPQFYVRDLEDQFNGEDLGDIHVEDEGLTVADIMTPSVYSVGEDATVSEVASTMLSGHVHRLLVTRGEEVVGIISTSDLLGLLVDED